MDRSHDGGGAAVWHGRRKIKSHEALEKPRGRSSKRTTTRTNVLYHERPAFARGVCPVVRKNLQQARKAADMTQQAMADKLGVGLRHYKKIECGETLGSVPLWDELEDVLGVNQRVLREIHPDTEGSQ